MVEVEFEFYCGNSWAKLMLASPATHLQVSTNHVTDYFKTETYTFDTNDATIVFKKTNKNTNDTIVENNVIVRDQYVKIKSIRIDNILIDQQLVQSCISYVPLYSQGYIDYCNEHCIVPQQELHCTAFYFDGTISFNFKIPFWPWYADLRRHEILKNFNTQDIEMYFGIKQTTDQTLLKKLKALIQDHV